MKFTGIYFKPAFLLLISLFIVQGTSCGQKQEARQPDEQYDEAALLSDRMQKNTYLKNASDSPIPQNLRTSFAGLKYFLPDAKYSVKARLVPFDKMDTLNMLTTKKEKPRKMLRFGTFNFLINGKSCKLVTYVILPVNHPLSFFVPFLDSTTGKESYHGGRYLDIDELPGNENYVLDFNLAYNPYCAYNDRYSCPLVPEENTLPVAINAGEKDYHK